MCVCVCARAPVCLCVSENAMKKQALVERAMKVCKKIVSAFSYSWKKKKALRRVQQEMNLPTHKLKTACPTRWGSMQMMMARILEQKNAITQVGYMILGTLFYCVSFLVAGLR